MNAPLALSQISAATQAAPHAPRLREKRLQRCVTVQRRGVRGQEDAARQGEPRQ